MACMNTWGRGGGQRPSTAVLLLALLLLALLLGFVQQHLQLGRGASWGETPHPPPSAALGPLRGAAAQANKAPEAPSPCIYSEPIVLPQVRALALSEAAPRPAISQISPTQKQLRGVGPKLPVVPRPEQRHGPTPVPETPQEVPTHAHAHAALSLGLVSQLLNGLDNPGVKR